MRFAFIFMLLCCFTVSAATAQTYGERLEGFDYPYAVKVFEFESQGQKLEMAYMDVVPAVPNGQVAVLLHGKNFCSATWAETIKALGSAGYRVIAPDQIGFCKSSKPRGYQFSFNQLAANTQALMASLDISQFTLIGHSIGGMLSIRYALNYPQDVSHLVLVNPIGLEDWQAKGVPYASLDALHASELNTTFDGIKAYQQRMYYDGQWKPEYEAPVAMLAGMYSGAGREIVAYNQAQTSDMLFSQPVIYELGRLAMPVLLLIGEKDRTAPGSNRAPVALASQLGNYPILARAAAAIIPQAKLVAFPLLGHSPQMEDPADFHKALLHELATE